MVSLVYSGAFPEKVSRLAVLDGVTNFPGRRIKPIETRIAEWVAVLDKTARRKIHRYASVADAAERMRGRNARLTPEQAMHLATHALKQDADGAYIWKFDPYLRAPAPYRLSLEDHIALWLLRARRYWSPAAKAFCRIPKRPVCSGISGRRNS
jgi:hypothetical protein